MEHIESIIWLISLPIMIVTVYAVSVYALKLYRKNSEETTTEISES
jgi:hypothetical protein